MMMMMLDIIVYIVLGTTRYAKTCEDDEYQYEHSYGR